MRFLILSAIALASLGVSAAGRPKPEFLPLGSAKQVEEINAVVLGLMELLGAHPTKCPSDVLASNERIVVFFCGAIPSGPGEETKTTIDSYLIAERRARSTGGAWVDDKGNSIRFYSIRGVHFTVRIAAESSVVVLSYPMQCFPPPLPDPLQDGEVLTYPELIAKAPLEYPRKHFREQADLVFQAVIGTDGKVGGMCLLFSSNPGHGFEEAAVEAVRKWRFKPGLLNGEPVSIPFTAQVSFRH